MTCVSKCSLHHWWPREGAVYTHDNSTLKKFLKKKMWQKKTVEFKLQIMKYGNGATEKTETVLTGTDAESDEW